MKNPLRTKFLTPLLVAGAGPLGRGLQAQTNYQVIKSFGFPALSTGAEPLNQLIKGTDGKLYGTAVNGGTADVGVVFKMNTDGSSYQVLHSFAGGTNDGQFPEGALLQASDGLLYGTTYQGGSNSVGTIFVISTTGTGYKILRHLSSADGTSPYAGLIEGRTDGVLYGTTSFGGPVTFYGGTVFSMNKDGSGFTVLANFNDNTGSEPKAGVLEGADGFLYGLSIASPTSGPSIFKVSKAGGIQALHFFLFTYSASGGDGGNPVGNLVQGPDNFIYGTTENGGFKGPGGLNYGNGTIFKISQDFSSYQVIHQFAANTAEGYYPNGGLIFGQDGNLYGQTSQGGAGAQGTVYKLSTNGSGFSVVYNLQGQDGLSPVGDLIQGSDGTFYGNAYQGGLFGNGTSFKLAGTNFTVIHAFVSVTGGDGAGPQATPLIDGSEIYGGTSSGGVDNFGALFRVKTDGTGYTILYNFTNGNSDGDITSGLIKGRDGYLYGTLPNGGTNNGGAIFKVSTNGDNYAVLYSFNFDTNGYRPQSALVQGPDGYLYGTTPNGGLYGDGTVFKINTNGAGFTSLYSFQGYVAPPGGGGGGGGEESLKGNKPAGLSNGTIDGQGPAAPLIVGADGMLYGTTQYGGDQNGAGTVYKISTDGSIYVDIYNFQNAPNDGEDPAAPLVQGANGLLYGVTRYGGSNYSGTVFSMDTNGNSETILYSFAGTPDGGVPSGALGLKGNTLYGITENNGVFNEGGVFTINTDGSGYSFLHSFADGDINYPVGGIALDANGAVYGVAEDGGASGFGGLFKLTVRKGVKSTIPVTHSGQSLMVSFSGGVPGSTYSIQASANAGGGWQTVGSSMADTNGVFSYLDSDSTNHAVRFYRSYGP